MKKRSFGDKISIKSLEKKKENWGKSLLINDLFVSVPVYLPQVARKIKPPVMTGSVSSPVATEAKIYKLLSSPYTTRPRDTPPQGMQTSKIHGF